MDECKKSFSSEKISPEELSTTTSPSPRIQSESYLKEPTASTSSTTNIYSIGHRDLDPLGGVPLTLPPPFGGRMLPSGSPLMPLGHDNGGGNIMGPSHPLFQRDTELRAPDSNWNRDSRLPAGSVPPGARFDPILPGSLPPRGAPHGLPPFLGPSLQGRGSNSRPFSGEPDNDMFPPPGYNDMFM
ncbi:hypothetical protein HMI54_005002 [Coelomomyces lativittatus]|nr:hypothetical protein HMI56_001747 [Coelomomyces lativittatus]KAJ1506528.1 hypothetical protein HMI54_005002 [Coelomomyces lativittatus]